MLGIKTLSELPDWFTFVVALAALVFSFITHEAGQRAQRRLQELQSLQANGAQLIAVWQQIADNPDVLRFHSTYEAELQAHDINHKELAYLLVLFESAAYYYQHTEVGTGPFPEDSLRYEILKSPDTRKAWPIMRRFFTGNNHYVDRIEATIVDIIQKEQNKQMQ